MGEATWNAGHLWLDGRWCARARIELDAAGRVARLATDAPPADAGLLGRWVLPGMPNVHSHAFQRAMAGLAERRGRDDDSFWTWRESMYAFAARIGPDELQAIAAQLYVEMLKAGYTQVCEFHYLHQQPDGTPYADPAAMSLALVEAAREAGIGLTLLPVLYLSGGFDGRPLAPRQQRFGHTVESFLRMVEQLQRSEDAMLRIGVALHSLRAVPEAPLAEVLAAVGQGELPIHIHIAEQLGEVQDCLAARNARPIEWLLDHAPVDARWCLVHATHADAGELRRLAACGAVAGLCPTTEANLGDGLFPLADYLDANGRLAVGSDSNISVSPVQELRLLEYGQRLASRHRAVAARKRGASVAETLWSAALRGGAQAAGILPLCSSGEGVAGSGEAPRADFLVLDDTSPLLAARDAGSLLDSLVFAGDTPLVRDVMVGGQWQVREGCHRDEQRIAERYRATVEQLAAN
ncbi:MAG TPA: formimidoylglutamate deiminase [Rhodanobacteraceae bacterium]|nr:formimidoylglutamate deiminase [Rhodanobacteraceae bacterium]